MAVAGINSTLNAEALCAYVTAQLASVFPPPSTSVTIPARAVRRALERLGYCFRQIRVASYYAPDSGQVRFNHMHSDQYLMFLYILSHELFAEHKDSAAATAIYYLNKVLHSFDCMYDTVLPEIFMIAHGVGIVLGKAKYGNYFYATTKTTVGSHAGESPVLGSGVALGAGAAVIGGCSIGNLCSVGAGTVLMNMRLPDRHSAWRDRDGVLVTREAGTPLVERVFFNPGV